MVNSFDRLQSDIQMAITVDVRWVLYGDILAGTAALILI